MNVLRLTTIVTRTIKVILVLITKGWRLSCFETSKVDNISASCEPVRLPKVSVMLAQYVDWKIEDDGRERRRRIEVAKVERGREDGSER